MKALEDWLNDRLSAVLAKSALSGLYGLGVFISTLLLGVLAAPIGTAIGASIATLYWIRPDSVRYRLFPVLTLIIANFILYF